MQGSIPFDFPQDTLPNTDLSPVITLVDKFVPEDSHLADLISVPKLYLLMNRISSLLFITIIPYLSKNNTNDVEELILEYQDNISELEEKIDKLRETGITILIVEQNARLSLSRSDRGYIFANGKVVHSGDAKDILNDPEIGEYFLGNKSD